MQVGRRMLHTAVALAMILVSVPAWSAVVLDSPTDLGVLDGYTSGTARAVNDSGQIVGESSNGFDDGRAFLWLPQAAYGLAAGLHDLGVLDGYTDSAAADINDQGQVVGSCWDLAGARKAFIWLPEAAYGLTAGMHPLDGLANEVQSMAMDINDAGQVVGDSFVDTGNPWPEARGFIWQNGVATALTVSATDSTPIRLDNEGGKLLNESGQVIGRLELYLNPDDEYPVAYAVVWQTGAATVLTPAGQNSEAAAINENGEVVGRYGEAYDVFLWLPAAAYGLESGCHLLAAEAGREFPNQIFVYDINDSGQIVGWCSPGSIWEPDPTGETEGTYIAVPGALWLWQNGAFTDIATMDDSVSGFWINAAGKVAGWTATPTWDDEWNFLGTVQRGYQWSDAAGLQTLSTLGGTGIEIYAIGPAGQAVGTSSLTDDTAIHACAWGIVAPVNQPPTAEAGPTQSVAVVHDGLAATNTALVTLDGSASSDPDGDALTFTWMENDVEIASGSSPSVNLAVGEHTLTLNATDPSGSTASDTVVITVDAEPNAAPSAKAGPDQNPKTRTSSATVTLDGSGCSDADGDPLLCTWTENSLVIATGAQPSVSLGLGTHTITLTVTDDYGASASDEVVVTVSQQVSALTISNATAVRKGRTITVTFTVRNPSTTTASNVNLTAATLGGSSTNSALPLALKPLKAGASKSCSLKFNGAAVPKGNATLSVEGASSLGAFFSSQSVSVP